MAEPKSPTQVLRALIAAFIAAITTDRSNAAEIARIKAEHAKELEELRGQLTEAEADDAEIAEISKLADEALALASAARPPLQAQIDLVNAIEPKSPEDAIHAGEAPPLSNIPDSSELPPPKTGEANE
jgi:hypothetical protein